MPPQTSLVKSNYRLARLAKFAGRSLFATALFLFSFVAVVWGQSSLWVSSSQGKTLYLMGSIHVLQESHYPLPKAMEDAFTKSDIVVFEIDQEEMESAQAQQLVINKGFYKGEDTLVKHISAATFQALTDHLKKLQLPVALFQKMKPANCALVLTMMEFQRLGYEARFGLDLYFANKATMAAKEKGALETTEFQINLFFDLPGQEQEMFLSQTLVELNNLAAEADKMYTAWQMGKSDNLHQILSASFEQFPGLYQSFIVKRNRNWTTQIEELLNQHQTVLVVVGVGHLVGPQSLIRMLEQKGHTFSQH